ncbi:unnamed protein product [Closterium sp. NIES-64]|nr:unnamed protein product [Closterium sp. NIES-64]
MPASNPAHSLPVNVAAQLKLSSDDPVPRQPYKRAVLCSAVMCCAVMCCAVMCCAVLCCNVMCGNVLCGVVLCGVVLCGVVLCWRRNGGGWVEVPVLGWDSIDAKTVVVGWRFKRWDASVKTWCPPRLSYGDTAAPISLSIHFPTSFLHITPSPISLHPVSHGGFRVHKPAPLYMFQWNDWRRKHNVVAIGSVG